MKLYKVKYKLYDSGQSKFGWACNECTQGMIDDDVIHPQTYAEWDEKNWICPVCNKQKQGESK